MPDEVIYTLPDSEITLVGAPSLGNPDQGDASHLLGAVITLTSRDWVPVTVTDTDSRFEDSDNSQTLTNATTYDGQSFAAGRRVEAEYTLVVETPEGDQYTLIGFNINEPGVTSYTTIEGLAFIDPAGAVPNKGGFPPSFTELTVISVDEGPRGGSAPSYASYATPACFTPGTLLDTPDGPRRIETLKVGDMVWTREEGPMPVRWRGETRFGIADVLAQPNLRPVRLMPGALGPGLPDQTLTVSPQHRILIEGWQAEVLYGAPEVLVAARFLVDGTYVQELRDLRPVTYIHLAFDRHVTVMSNGLPTESYFPRAETLSSFPATVQDEIRRTFPDLDARFAQSRHPSLTAREARLLEA